MIKTQYLYETMHPSASSLRRSSENIPLLELPAVENMWGMLVCWIHSKNRKYDKIVELKDAIIEAWNTIDDKIIKKNFISIIEDRIFGLIRRG